MHFPFMDTIAGNVTSYDPGRNVFDLETAAGQHFEVQVAGEVSAELLRNLDEPYADAGDHLSDMLSPGRQLFVYGVFYPEGGGYTFEAKHITFLGRQAGEFNFEKSSWWVNQIDSIARFYRRAQFGNSAIDYREYRTVCDGNTVIQSAPTKPADGEAGRTRTGDAASGWREDRQSRTGDRHDLPNGVRHGVGVSAHR